MNNKKLISEFEYLRQGYADVLDLLIPYLPIKKQLIAIATYEAYHFYADKKVVDLGGESVNREYKTLKRR